MNKPYNDNVIQGLFERNGSKNHFAQGNTFFIEKTASTFLLINGEIEAHLFIPPNNPTTPKDSERRSRSQRSIVSFERQAPASADSLSENDFNSFDEQEIQNPANFRVISTLKPGVVFSRNEFRLFRCPIKLKCVSACVVLEIPNEEFSRHCSDKDLQRYLHDNYRNRLMASQLPGLPYFSTLPTEVANIIAQRSRLLRFEKGKSIIDTGEMVSDFYIIRSGVVKIAKTLPNGSTLFFYLGPGSFFGENSPLCQVGLEVDIEATENKPDYMARGGKKMFILRNGFTINDSADADLTLVGPDTDKVNYKVSAKNDEVMMEAQSGSIVINGQSHPKIRLNEGDLLKVGAHTLKCNHDIRKLYTFKYSCLAEDSTVELIAVNRSTIQVLCAKSRKIDQFFSRLRKERNQSIESFQTTTKPHQNAIVDRSISDRRQQSLEELKSLSSDIKEMRVRRERRQVERRNRSKDIEKILDKNRLV